MADVDIGTIITDVFNAENVKLGYIDGADTKFFASLQEITEHWEKPETAIQTRLGTVFLYSKNHNNFVDFKMAVTRSEIATLHGFHQSLEQRTWVIKGTDENNQTTGATLSFTGKLPIMDKTNVVPGGYLLTCRIRATQNNVLVT